MAERPILFSPPMVRAILSGAKSQTRRVLKVQPIVRPDLSPSGLLAWMINVGAYMFGDKPMPEFVKCCPYGQPGDKLWVRENFSVGEDLGEGWEPWMSQGDRFVLFEDGYQDYKVPENYVIPRNAKETHHNKQGADHWRQFGTIPSIHMPRWASRILLEITAVRVERLQDISEADAKAEGVDHNGECDHARRSCEEIGCWGPNSYRGGFADLWWAINGPGSWESNPWVWVIEFRVAK